MKQLACNIAQNAPAGELIQFLYSDISIEIIYNVNRIENITERH